MLKTESAPIQLRWTAQNSICRPQSVQEEVPVTIYAEQKRKSIDSDGSSSPGGRKSDDSDSEADLYYQCPCGKKFSRSSAYTRHVDVAHSNAECYKCEDCGKTFGNQRTLTMHMSVHRDSKQFTSTIERCSKSKSSSKSHRSNGLSTTVVTSSATRITDVKTRTVSKSVSLQESVNLESITLSSGEESTDKENYNPIHPSDPETEPDSNPEDSVPPLINSKHQASHYELDLSFPKSKAKSGSSETLIVSSDSQTITSAEFHSRFGTERPGVDGNKVSIITIKTDRSLLSDSLVFQTKKSKSGDLLVTPGSHSVIVIKTQDLKHKQNDIGNTLLEPVNIEEFLENSNDPNNLRKSQRLQGKVPGWKQMLDGDWENRGKRRRMNKVKTEELSQGYDMPENTQDDFTQDDYNNMGAENMGADDGEYGENPKRQRQISVSKDSCGTVKAGVFKCRMCDRSFESEKYLSMHMSLHKVDNSMESLMQHNNKDDELEEITAKTIKAATTNTNGAFWTCKICNKIFAQNSNYKNHIRTHSDERPFVCQICSIGFKERYHLKKHMLFKHSNELKEECRYCGKRFKDSTAVRAHERIHSDVRPYSCRRCGKSFKTSECLWHHENRSKTCGQALIGMPAASPRFKRGRQAKKEPDTPQKAQQGITVIPMSTNGQHQFISGESLLLADSNQMLNAHLGNVHQYSYHETQAATAALQNQQTHLVSMSQPQLVKVHCNPIVATSAITHTQMSSMTYGKPATTMHFVTAANTVFQAPLGYSSPVMVKVEPECALPDYELTAMTASTDSSYGDGHDDILMDEDPSMPSVAMLQSESEMGDISQETIMQLQEEINRDSAIEDIEISLLEKTYEDFDIDEEDVMEEGEELPSALGNSKSDNHYTCDKCGKNFVSVSAFDKHLLTHSGLRPYVCPVCHVGFKLKVHLKKHHLYRHSDEKPCECSICGKKFKDSSAVRLHERIHSTDRPFECECGKTFKTRENLWGHRHRGPCDRKASFAEMIVSSGSQTIAANEMMISESLHVQSPPTITVSLPTSNADLPIGLTAGQVPADRSHELVFTRSGLPQPSQRISEPHQIIVATRSDGTPVIFTRSQESRVSLPVLSAMAPQVGVPTAVVAPLKREVIVTSATTTPVTSSTSILKPIKQLQPNEVYAPMKQDTLDKALVSDPGLESSLPPFETFSPMLRGKAPSVAERCPTIQRYLQMAHQPVKLPGIQQLFQSHSLQGVRSPTGINIAAMAQGLVQMRCPDPNVPLGPHPSHAVNPSGSPQHLPSPANQDLYQSPLKSPQKIAAAPRSSPVSSRESHIPSTESGFSTSHSVTYLTPSKSDYLKTCLHHRRALSPYPGSLPLLLPVDPNMASTSGDMPSQSPADAGCAKSSHGHLSWDEEKKTPHVLWQSEHEQLFQDLTQTTAFGQL